MRSVHRVYQTAALWKVDRSEELPKTTTAEALEALLPWNAKPILQLQCPNRVHNLPLTLMASDGRRMSAY